MDNKVIMQRVDMFCTLDRLALQILEKYDVCDSLMLVGIQRRGVFIAKYLYDFLQKRMNNIVMGIIDINLYRDDWTSLSNKPNIGQSNIPKSVDNMNIILVDDVLYTGRTIRATLEAVLDYGRPKKIELLVLIDRGHRELPITANYVGKNVPTSKNEIISVRLSEIDNEDSVTIKE